MSVNTVQISQRSVGFSPGITANGSYTLPQFAFIPHPSLQQLAGPMVMEPTLGGTAPAAFAAPMQLQRPYPIPDMPHVYGIRTATFKASP